MWSAKKQGVHWPHLAHTGSMGALFQRVGEAGRGGVLGLIQAVNCQKQAVITKRKKGVKICHNLGENQQRPVKMVRVGKFDFSR